MRKHRDLEQEQAWTGDAILGLFCRNWILREFDRIDAEIFARMTSNNFLNTLGNPTKVEAEIGRIFIQEGIEKAFDHIEKVILPHFLLQEKKRIRQAGGKR